MTAEKRLNQLKINETAIIEEINCEGMSKRRYLDLGLVAGTKIRALFKSPFNDPVAYQVRGAVIALRIEESSKITISQISQR